MEDYEEEEEDKMICRNRTRVSNGMGVCVDLNSSGHHEEEQEEDKKIMRTRGGY